MTTAAASYAAPHSHLIVDLPLEQIQPSADNPRVEFDAGELANLAKSLRDHGQIEPIVVRPLVKDGTYELIAGERRYRAAKLAGLSHLSAIIREDLATDDRATRALRLIENLHRVQLNPVEEAHGFAALRDALGMTQTEIAKLAGRAQPAIAKRLALLKLPPDVQGYLRRGTLTQSHADALVNLAPWPAIQSRLAELAASQAWPVIVLEKPPRAIWDDLVREKLVLQVGSGMPPRYEECNHCPFGALRKVGDTYITSYYCLQPAHAVELAAEVDRRWEERKAAQQAAAVDTGETRGVPAIATLGRYERLDYSWITPPPGCTEACPCRSSAADRDGTIVPVCLNPHRYLTLREAEQAAKLAATKALATRRRAQIAAYQEGSITVDNRLLPALVAKLLRFLDTKAGRRACATFSALDWPKGEHAPTIQELALYDNADLEQIAVAAIVEDEILVRDRWSGSPLTATEWLFGPDGESSPDPLEQTITGQN